MSTRTTAVAVTLSFMLALAGLAGCGGGGGDGGGGNADPVINSLTAAAQALWQGGTTVLTASAQDSNGDALTYGWTATGGTFTGSGTQVSYSAPATGGVYRITLTVTDGRGGQDVATLDITVGATVQGTVNDTTAGGPAAGVTVLIDGLSDTTDNDGAFSIVGVSQGQHDVLLGGNWVISGSAPTVNATTPGQIITLPSPIPGMDLGSGPPPPPFPA